MKLAATKVVVLTDVGGGVVVVPSVLRVVEVEAMGESVRGTGGSVVVVVLVVGSGVS